MTWQLDLSPRAFLYHYFTVKSSQKLSHSRLSIFLHIRSNHGHFHLLEVILHASRPLCKILKFLVQLPMVVRRDETSSHYSLHLRPCLDRTLAISPSASCKLVPPHHCVVRKFDSSQLNFLGLRIVMAFKYKLDLFLPLEISFRIRSALERRD